MKTPKITKRVLDGIIAATSNILAGDEEGECQESWSIIEAADSWARRVRDGRPVPESSGAMTVDVTVRLTRDQRRAINLSMGKPGLADAEECVSWIEMAASADLQTLETDEQNEVDGGVS